MAKKTIDSADLSSQTEATSKVLEIVSKVLSESQALTSGQHRWFPNGVGLFDLQTTIEIQKISINLRIADALYPAQPPKPLRILAIADDILNFCISLDNSDDPVMKDCNAFVKKVGTQFGVAIPDRDADGIVDSFSGAPFTKTTMDPATAMSWANDGLVVAGMKLSELNPKYGAKYKNGHVAIVHATADPNHPGFPMASWGALGGRGHANMSIRQSFPAAACDDNALHFAFAPTS